MSAATSSGMRAQSAELTVDRATRVRSRANKAASIEAQTVADALGEPFTAERFTVADLAADDAAIAGLDAALAELAKRIPVAEAAEEQALVDQRVARGRHVANVIIPPLLVAAQEAGQAFADALAELAAAEDKLANRLQRRLPLTHVNGNASALLMAMVQSKATNVFFEAGPGRGPWDVPAYAAASAQLDDQLQEIAA